MGDMDDAVLGNRRDRVLKSHKSLRFLCGVIWGDECCSG